MVSAAQTGSPGDGDGGSGAGTSFGGGDGHLDALPLIGLFGGIRPMAAKLGVPVSTVQGWRERNAIPTTRLGSIKDAAAKHDIAILPEHVILQVGPPPTAASAPGDDSHADSPDPADVTPEPATQRARPALAAPGLVPGLAGAAVVIAVIALLVAMFSGGDDPVDGPAGALMADAVVADAVVAQVEALADSADSIAARVSVLETLAAETTALADRVARIETGVVDGIDSVDGDAAARFADVQGEIDQLSATVGDLAATVKQAQGELARLATAPTDGLPDGAALAERVDDLAAAVAVVSAGGGLADDGVDLAARLDRLEAALSRPALGAGPAGQRDLIALGFATVALRQQLAAGGSLAAALARAAAVSQDDAVFAGLVAAVADAAGDGPVATRAALERAFEAVAPGLTRTAVTVGDDAGWLARAQARLAQVVTVERLDGGGVTDDGADPAGVAVAEARAGLATGGMAAAATAVASVAEGNAAAESWVTQARRRLAVEAAVVALEAAVFDRLVFDGQAGD